MRWVGLSTLGVAFWAGIFAILSRLLRYFRDVPDLGPLLAAKLLSMVLVGFFSILVLSNVITALSSFFLARDLDLLAAAPVRWHSLYVAKLIETLVSSSWMVALMTVPLVTAYGVVYSGGPWFPLVAIAALGPLFVIPAAVGCGVTLLLVNAFPARRTRDILSVVAVLSGAGLVLLFRLLRPERLARPEGFQSLSGYLAALQTPSSPWLPSEWAQRAIMDWLSGARTLAPLAALWATASAVVGVGAVLHRGLYFRGFSKAQDGAGQGRAAGAAERGILYRGAYMLLSPLGVQRRELVLKEVRVFFRDTTQWSQLLLLGVLIIVYVFNVKFLPLTGEGISFFLRQTVPFLNLVLTGFVLASIAARFVFPSVSLEGRTLWLLRASPLRARDLLWSKYWVGTLPLLVLALGLTTATNTLLDVGDFIFAVTLFTVALLTFAVSALALCFGTLYPQFETENAAQIPTSFGGLVYMMTAITLLGLVTILEARPVYVYLFAQTFGRGPGWGAIREMAVGFSLAGTVCIAATVVPIRVAVRTLEAVERG